MISSHAPDAGQDTPGRRPARSGARRRFRTALVLLAALSVAVGIDAAVVAARVDQVDVDLTRGPGDADGRTWVLVGLDSRASLPDGADVRDFGTPEAVPGARADVIVVVHQTDAGTTAFSVPRDLRAFNGRSVGRLAVSWLDGPASTVSALCRLGIPTDHLVTVDLAGFTAMVDAVGGVTVDVPRPVRDPAAGLLLRSTGAVHVDGATALGLIRSRHPEHLTGGVWTPAAVDPDGRAAAAGAVLSALLDGVHGAALRPWQLQAVAWAASGAVTVDPGTSVTDLIALAGAGIGPVGVLPVSEPVGSTLTRLPTADTAAALAAAGLACAG
ncbi:LCP family protein [Blastococcus sp. VKM Ac-2987]|uniref:LCP family protein n=1 Tax=Blastococcus sp. VKM Ac-2987 TaxID=3004141 RepID=UPI0022ABA211|nr:LCP family protein [Blastococcus sp. VKM Ac-2987]MCZ2859899.1 LCP family protein [Blastococcus sp. VKM Ac-2987]